MNETILLEQLLEQKRYIEKIHKINDDLSRHLIGSIIQLLKYGEKYNVMIPKKQQLEQTLLNTKEQLEKYNYAVEELDSINRYFTERKNNHRFDSSINNKRYIVQVL